MCVAEELESLRHASASNLLVCGTPGRAVPPFVALVFPHVALNLYPLAATGPQSAASRRFDAAELLRCAACRVPCLGHAEEVLVLGFWMSVARDIDAGVQPSRILTQQHTHIPSFAYLRMLSSCMSTADSISKGRLHRPLHIRSAKHLK